MSDRQDAVEYEETNFQLDDYLNRIKSEPVTTRQGILILPQENWHQSGKVVFSPETFNFVKWVKQHEANADCVNLVALAETKTADLRSHDFWFPLAFLFSDVTLQLYLNMVANYLYDRLKGAIHGENPTIDLQVLVQESKKGKIKKLTYHGSCDGLQRISEKIDINKLMEK